MRDKKGRHLTAFDRHEIWLGIREGKSARKIAEGLGCSPSTVTREIKAGTMTRVTRWGRGLRHECRYDYRYAQAEAERRGSKKGRQLKIGSDHETARVLERYIVEEGHSPYAALVKARANGELGTQICTNTLYSYIRKGVLDIDESCLLHGFRSRRKEKPLFENRAPAKIRIGGESIEMRPKSVLKRTQFGHWEADLVVSAKGGRRAVLTIVERKSRYLIAGFVDDKRQASIAATLDEIEAAHGPEFRELFRSITFDNGLEFRNTDSLSASAYMHLRNAGLKRFEKVYYAHPYCSGERGTNENTNRMLRRTYPKGTIFDDVPPEDLAGRVTWINDYPRAVLGGLSARAVFEREVRRCKPALAA